MNIINKKYNKLHDYSTEFIDAKPYPHIILDNFLDEKFFSQLDIDNFTKDPSKGLTFDTDLEKNKLTSKNDKLSNNLKLIVDKLNSFEFINNLRSLSKIKELFSTTSGNTAIANYHEMYRSGFLGIHVDHSSEPNTGLPHVLNIILYLSNNSDKNGVVKQS